MSSKDILSIREFEIEDGQDAPELYPRTFALPQFFSHNFIHDFRIVKLFTGENALLKAFYFNYMKLALESEDSEDYIALLKEKFVGFDLIEEGQLQDKFLSDFQYRKLFKDFIEIANKNPSIDFQSTANRYPIIDRILEKLFKTIVPIGLFFIQNDQKQASEFDVAVQVLSYLSQEFEQEFQIQTPGKCINFVPTDMHMYFQSMNEIYLTYVEEYDNENDEKINGFLNSNDSSFVCGQGNSFTSKFKFRRQTQKHPFRRADLKSAPNNTSSVSSNNQFKETSNSYISQNLSKELKETVKQLEFQENQERKCQLLEKNASIIRRRTKNLTEVQQKKTILLEPKLFYQADGQNGNSSLVYSAIKSDNQEDDKEKANTLINILDSRVTESNSRLSNSLEKGSDKFTVIVRRNVKKSNSMFESKRKDDEQTTKELLKPVTGQQQTFLTDSTKLLLKLQSQFGAPINLPQPQPKEDQSVKFSQNVETIQITNSNSNIASANSSPTSYFTFKTTAVNMEEILELGQDQDTQNEIQQFCEVEFANPSMSEKTVNLSENVSHKLMIGIIQSRNYNMSKTSLANGITPAKKDANLSFFNDSNPSSKNSQVNSSIVSSVSSANSSLSMSRSVSNNNEADKSFHEVMDAPKFESFKADNPKVQTSRIDAPRVETSRMESSRVETSIMDTPKFELFKYESPKFQSPKFDSPKHQSQKHESPRYGLSEFETPKHELPKLQQKKRTFQEFMKEMKEKIPFTEKPKNQIDSMFSTQKSRFSKFQKPAVKQFFQTEPIKLSTPLSEEVQKQKQSIPKRQQTQIVIDSKPKVQVSISKLQHSIRVEPSNEFQAMEKGKESDQKIVQNFSSWMPSGSDEFTKSDVLILLDQQYRSKIRAIKNDYKSLIKEDANSMAQKENLNFRSAFDKQQNGSLMKQSRSNMTKNESKISNDLSVHNDSRHDSNYNQSKYNDSKRNESRYNESRISFRSRETSIYVQER